MTTLDTPSVGPLAVVFWLVVFAAGVVFHGRDAVRREPGALFAAILSGSLFAAIVAAAVF